MVAIAHDEGERRPQRSPMTKACEHLHLVALDLLTRATPVPLLASLQVGVDQASVEGQARGKTGKDRDERRAVRFTCCRELQCHEAERTAACMTSTGAGTPVHTSNEAAP